MIAVVVPFRDDPHCPGARTEQLRRFISHFGSLFSPDEARVLVVEQSNDSRRFNRGQLLNVGYALASRGMGLMNTTDGCKRYRHVVFHDVDMLPDPSLKPMYLAPLLASAATLTPKHLKGYMSSVQEALCAEHGDDRGGTTESEAGTCMRIIFDAGNRYSNDACFGGVVIYDDSGMRLTNGYPNNFWGWGGEDNAMFARVVRAGVLIERVEGGTFEDLENLTVEAKMDALRLAGAKCKDKWKLLKWDKNKKMSGAGGGSEAVDQEPHGEETQSIEREPTPKPEPVSDPAPDSALKSAPYPAAERTLSEEPTWNWQCNGLAQLHFDVLGRETLRRSGAGPYTKGVAVALKVTVALGSALPDHFRCCECGRLLHESRFSGEQRRVAEWDRAKGKKSGVALSGVLKGEARCMECVANDAEVQRARENAAKNQADLSRRTCTVCGAVFASRNKLFTHMASTTCGQDDVDDGNTDARGCENEACLGVDMNGSARTGADATTTAAVCTETDVGAGAGDSTTVAAIAPSTTDSHDGDSYGIPCQRCTLLNEYGATQCSACGADLQYAKEKEAASTKVVKASDTSGVNKDARVLQLGRLFPQASNELLAEALAENADDVNDAAASLLAKGFGNNDGEGATIAVGSDEHESVAAAAPNSIVARSSMPRMVAEAPAAGASSTVFASLLPEPLPRQLSVADASAIDSVACTGLAGALPLPPAQHAQSRAASGSDWLALVLDSCDTSSFSIAQAVCRSWRTEAVRMMRWRFTHLRACADRELRGHTDAVGVLASISPSCRWHNGGGIVGRWLLASGSEDFTVRIWDVHAGQASGCTPVALLEGHEQLVIDLAVDPVHGMLFSASYDSSVRVWEIGSAWACLHHLQNKEIWRSYEHVHSVAVLGAGYAGAGISSSAATGQAGGWLCCGSDGGTICCWTLPLCEGAKVIGRHAARESGSSAVRALTSRGSMLYSGGDDGAICIWDCSCTNAVMELRVRRKCHDHFVRALCLCAPSKGPAAARYSALLASGSFDCTVRLSCAFTLEPVHVFAGQHTKVVRSLATSEHFLFSGSWDQRIAVFNINARVFEGRMLHAATYVNALAVLGDTLFSGSRQGYVRVWTPARPSVVGLPAQPKS